MLLGNNAVEMETTAIYDKSTKEWIVNSPSTLSQKYWITNGAVHAKHCVVFARTIIDGTDYGIHGVIVRIRDDSLNTMPGKSFSHPHHAIRVQTSQCLKR